MTETQRKQGEYEAIQVSRETYDRAFSYAMKKIKSGQAIHTDTVIQLLLDEVGA